MGKSTISMDMFNSYFKLPEGIYKYYNIPGMDQNLLYTNKKTIWLGG